MGTGWGQLSPTAALTSSKDISGISASARLRAGVLGAPAGFQLEEVVSPS